MRRVPYNSSVFVCGPAGRRSFLTGGTYKQPAPRVCFQCFPVLENSTKRTHDWRELAAPVCSGRGPVPCLHSRSICFIYLYALLTYWYVAVFELFSKVRGGNASWSVSVVSASTLLIRCWAEGSVESVGESLTGAVSLGVSHCDSLTLSHLGLLAPA